MKSKKTRKSASLSHVPLAMGVRIEQGNDGLDYLVSLPKEQADLPVLERTTPKGKVIKYHQQYANQCMLLMSMAEDPEAWCKPERSVNLSSLINWYRCTDPYSPEMEYEISPNQRWNTKLRAAMPKAYYAYLTLRSWYLSYQESAEKGNVTFRQWLLDREVEPSLRNSIIRSYAHAGKLSESDYKTVAIVERLLRTI